MPVMETWAVHFSIFFRFDFGLDFGLVLGPFWARLGVVLGGIWDSKIDPKSLGRLTLGGLGPRRLEHHEGF